MCQLAWDLNSDRYDRSQNTDINNCQTRYHSTTALTAFCCLQFSMYLAAGVAERAAGVACARWAWRRQNLSSVKKQRTNAKSKWSKCCGLAISRRIQIYAMIGVCVWRHICIRNDILLDIKTMCTGPKVLFIRLLIYLGGVARLGTRSGRPRQNVVLLPIYCVRIQHILL